MDGLEAIEQRLSEKRIKKIEHRVVALSKDMNSPSGVRAQLEVALGRVAVLEQQNLIIGGRLASIEQALGPRVSPLFVPRPRV